MASYGRSSICSVVVLLAAASPTRSEIIDFSVRLSPECAGAISTAIGSGELQLNTDTGIMSYNIDFFTESSVLYSMFHGPYENACGGPPFGQILYWFADVDPPYIGTTEHFTIFTDLQMRELVARLHYVNIHTAGWPEAELRGYIELSRKSRYLSWHPWMVDDPRLAPGSSLGLRVTIESLPSYPGSEGAVLWVGPPNAYPEENASDPGKTFDGALLQCTPHLRDWSSLGSLHITGGDIAPDSAYRIDLYDPSCGNVSDPACFFGAYTSYTARFGDVVPPFAVADELGQPDFRDITAQVAKFLADPLAPIKAAVHLVPNTPNSLSPIDFRTIAAEVEGFLGRAYNELQGISGPCTCPSTIACGTTCGSDAECPGGVCFNGQCSDACGRCTP